MSVLFDIHPGEALRLFFEIPQAHIDQDLGFAAVRIMPILDEVAAFHAVGPKKKTAPLIARYYHNQLLTAHFRAEAAAGFRRQGAILSFVGDAGDHQ